MDYKFSNMDISKFDPTNASVDSVRKWLFAIIDAELDKAPDKRDYDLIKECSECEMELPVEDVGMSESDLIVGLERIKAHVTTGETKENKILISKKKSKKSVRVIVILAAVISVLLLSVTAMAVSQGKSVGDFISENIQKIFNMDAGEQIEEGDITLIKNGERQSFNSVEDAINEMQYNILDFTYLPNGIRIEKIIATTTKDGEAISFVTNDKNLYIRVTIGAESVLGDKDDVYIHQSGLIDYYIIEESEVYQAEGIYENVNYGIQYNNYYELLKILDGLKEIEK